MTNCSADRSETSFSTANKLEFFEALFSSADVGICVTNENHRFVMCNPSYCRAYGYSADELIGQSFTKMLPPNMRKRAGELHDAFLAGGSESPGEWEVIDKTGQTKQVMVTADRVVLADGRRYKVTTVSDTTETHRVQLEAHKLNMAIQQSQSCIVITDRDGNIEFVNDACVNNSGYTREELLGANPSIFQSGSTDKAVYMDLWATISAGKHWQGRLVNQRKDGSEYVEWVFINPVVDENNEIICFLSVKEDITEREQLTRQLRSLERFDALTGLANRFAFFEALEERLRHLKPQDTRQSLALINIDRFAGFNARHGHESGDRLLQHMAQSLVISAPKDALIARLGPDEFAVLPALEDRSASYQESRWLGGIQRELRKGWVIDGGVREVDASIGMAFFDQHCQSDGGPCRPGDVMRMADAALHSAKANGGGQIVFFDADVSIKEQETLQLQKDLSGAIERGEMYLALQAQVHRGVTLAGAEALLRWRHSTLGEISPGRFIPLAEDSGEIVQIGHWVLKQALAALASLQACDPSLTISVNVSAIQVQRTVFVDEVERLLKETRVIPSGLILEITESVFLDDPVFARERLEALRALGVGISIDDFGTGYSSLTYLKHLPVTELKIDQSFVNGLPDDEADAALVTIILSAAHHLHLRTVAEGVETPEQAEYFDSFPDTVLQGYLYDRPSDVKHWMEKWVKPRQAHNQRSL
ncbi:EAL domain-containing protein [Halomonas vilamensis]|uniref:EAL domain-containing protein n=1 Tax=Vreelandella vilamensis TaxID=531309 RepID=A0ABU1H1M0_9GAMM|nr:EAL domain-containing protein [Halomonas vilamensis]MDR5898204.1 EAL domain-containing protein [Halomonas vilamensis]